MSYLNVSWPATGRYILAISGGADSMVLLDMFARAASGRGYELIVAHFDHGIRAESAADRDFVEVAAARYGLTFEAGEGSLGSASEAAARAARHGWLEDVRERQQAIGILTAHHQDDLIETSLLNLARGSGRLGLAPMQPGKTIFRPLIDLSRADLRHYASEHEITWREDPTNADISNPRNFLRHRLLPAADQVWRARYLENLTNLAELNKLIAQSISVMLETYASPAGFDFPLLILKSLTISEREELILAAARALSPGIQLDRPLVSEIANFAISGTSGKHRPLRQGLIFQIVPGFAKLTTKSPH